MLLIIVTWVWARTRTTWQYFLILFRSVSISFLPESSCHFLEYLVKAFFLERDLEIKNSDIQTTIPKYKHTRNEESFTIVQQWSREQFSDEAKEHQQIRSNCVLCVCVASVTQNKNYNGKKERHGKKKNITFLQLQTVQALSHWAYAKRRHASHKTSYTMCVWWMLISNNPVTRQETEHRHMSSGQLASTSFQSMVDHMFLCLFLTWAGQTERSTQGFPFGNH